MPEGILAVGDLVTRPFPLIGYDSPRSWLGALDNILARHPSAIVPGHGEVMKSTEYVELFRDLFTEATSQVADALERGIARDGLAAVVRLERFWIALANGDEARVQAFEARFQPALVERILKEMQTSGS